MKRALISIGISFFISTAYADTLLIISSSGGMFGGSKLNLAFEKFGADLIANKLKPNYRKTYTWIEYSKADLETFVEEVIQNQQSGEPIDVFSLQHGWSSFLPDLQVQRVEQLFPYGMLRRVYSTGCSQWGTVDSDYTFSSPIISKNNYASHLTRLGVQEYIAHANGNYSGVITLPLLAQNLSKSENWLKGGLKSFEQTDSFYARVYPALKNLQYHLSALLGSKMRYLDVDSVIISRPVFGGLSELVDPLKSEQPLLPIDQDVPENYRELMLSPSEAFKSVLKQSCEKVFSDDWCKLPTTEPTASISQSLNQVVDVLQNLFTVYAQNANGCVDTEPFQHMVSAAFKTKKGIAPKLQTLCFKKIKSNEYALEFTLSPTPTREKWLKLGKQFQTPDIWEVVPNSEIINLGKNTINSLSIETKGSLRIRFKENESRLSIKGIGVNLDKQAIGGKLTNGLLHFGLRGLALTNSGQFLAKASAPLFAIPVSGKGKFENNGSVGLDHVLIFGIPFKLSL